MSTKPHSASPAAASLSRPPPTRSSSTLNISPVVPSIGLSRLTTRSSSTSKLYLEVPVRTETSQAAPASKTGRPYGAYREAKDRNEQRPVLVGRRRASSDSVRRRDVNGFEDRRGETSRGKGKAVVDFAFGSPSSSDDGDDENDVSAADKDLLEECEGTGGFEGDFAARWKTAASREPTSAEVIRAQRQQPVQTVDSLKLDSLLPSGIADYTFSRSPSPAESSPQHLAAPSLDSRKQLTQPLDPRVSLGSGKFSEVFLVQKEGTQYAMKHTPLHSHHPLIAARLLREPTILAQLLPHRNLVKVFETIRTPGHFYLVEENLQSWVTLEALVSSSPGGVLPPQQAWSVLEQLSSVVRSLHSPLKVCHRDIKPENILVRVTPPPPSAPLNALPSLTLKLLDFGLATHFSSSKPSLTTCCGSPAYHSPELWQSLRDQRANMRYWGPEIDIWCVGLTLLRCLRPDKYPLGTSHASLQAIADKTVNALLGIKDSAIRQLLGSFLNPDGKKRMQAFERFCAGLERKKAEGPRRSGAGSEARGDPTEEARPREFKSTSFLPSPPAHRLQLRLDDQSAVVEGPQLEATAVTLDVADGWATGLSQDGMRTTSTSTARTARPDSPQLSPTAVFATGLPQGLPDSPQSLRRSGGDSSSSASSSPARSSQPWRRQSTSSDSLASPYTPFSPSAEALSFQHPTYLPPIELILLNPANEGILRAVSYVKYALRCKGILYHVDDDSATKRSSLTSSLFSPPGSAPPSLPPTPYAQPARPLPLPTDGAFPFPTSCPIDNDESYTCYLRCVVALPLSDPSSFPGLASNALRSALQGNGSSTSRPRPGMLLRAQTLAGEAPRMRSASTPPHHAAGRKDQDRKEMVKALPFFLSIRKATSPTPLSSSFVPTPARKTSGSTTPSSLAFPLSQPPLSASRRRRPSASPRRSRLPPSSRIILTLSDPRALPFVRDALALPPRGGEEDSAKDSSASNPRCGRTSGVGELSPRGHGAENSGSRDARARREGRRAEDQVPLPTGTKGKGRPQSIVVRGSAPGGDAGQGAMAHGLRMEMGRPAVKDRSTSLFGFDLAGLMGKVMSGIGGSPASGPTE
ncbi:hypothetical protein JCM11641_003980 [Rhodosporidiobolus odoratus]